MDPDGHLLEILTRPYGGSGTAATNPHRLVAEKLDSKDAENRETSGSAADALVCAEQP